MFNSFFLPDQTASLSLILVSALLTDFSFLFISLVIEGTVPCGSGAFKPLSYFKMFIEAGSGWLSTGTAGGSAGGSLSPVLSASAAAGVSAACVEFL